MEIVIQNVDALTLPVGAFNGVAMFNYLKEKIENYIEKTDKKDLLEDAIKNDYFVVTPCLK